jgi:protein AaeX
MIGEFDIGGVFVPAPAVWAAVAIIVSLFLRRLLHLAGFYQLVWHRGLFELALLTILWGTVTYFATLYGVPDAMNLH